MVERYHGLNDNLVAFDSKTGFLYLLERTTPYTLIIFSVDSGEEYLRSKLPDDIRFKPTQLLPNRDYLAVIGDSDVYVLCPKQLEHAKPLGWKQHVTCVQWHPLNENYLGVLTGNNQLSLYDVEGNISRPQVYDLGLSWTDDSPVAFQFLGESPLTLMRFCCLFLTTNGNLYALSPVLPAVFTTTEEFESFDRVLSVARNTYLKREPRLGEWFSSLVQALTATDLYGVKKHFAVSQEHFHTFTPVLRRVGTLRTTGYFEQLVVLNSANPSVVAVISREGSVCLCVAFGDIVPRFTQAEPEDFYEVYEEIQTDSNGYLQLGEMKKLYYLSRTRLYQIYIPWLSEMQESFQQRVAARTFSESVVELTEAYCGHTGMALVQRGVGNNFIVIPQEDHLKVVPFTAINRGGPILQSAMARVGPLVPERIPLERVEAAPLHPFTIQIDEFTNEHEELASFQKMLTKLVSTQLKPLDERVNFLRERITEFKDISEKLKKELNIIAPDGLSALENSCKNINYRVECCQENSKRIEKRIDEILSKQKRIRRPLSQVERQCDRDLTELIDKSQALMANSNSVRLIVDTQTDRKRQNQSQECTWIN